MENTIKLTERQQKRKKLNDFLLEKNDDVRLRGMTRRNAILGILENQEKYVNQNLQSLAQFNLTEATAPSNATGAAVATWAPVLISMVKRMAPKLIALDFMGTQPLKTPDGLIFAMRARYDSQTGDEAFFQNIKTGFSGDGTADAGDGSGFTKAIIDTYNGNTAGAAPVTGKGMTTDKMEKLGSSQAWAKMGVSIEKQQVSALGRGLYADFSHELRQDMLSVHGEDVEAILSDMLAVELQAEMNREFIRTMNLAAKVGYTAGNGIFNLTTDSDGRWLLERLKGLMFRIELEANAVAKDSRRGKANRILCSANVASALVMAGMLDYTPALAAQAGMDVDVTGSSFAGVLSNGMPVYIDPYSTVNYITLAYKGESEMDSGIFYCPYTMVEMYRGQGEDTFQPRLALKTRYGIVANPFCSQNADGSAVAGKGLGQSENYYFRKMLVKGIEE